MDKMDHPVEVTSKLNGEKIGGRTQGSQSDQPEYSFQENFILLISLKLQHSQGYCSLSDEKRRVSSSLETKSRKNKDPPVSLQHQLEKVQCRRVSIFACRYVSPGQRSDNCSEQRQALNPASFSYQKFLKYAVQDCFPEGKERKANIQCVCVCYLKNQNTVYEYLNLEKEK